VIDAAGLLGGHAHFVHWGVIQISLANLVVLLLMVVVFALAVTIRLPHANDEAPASDQAADVHD
jgi:uncharacterized membrane protein